MANILVVTGSIRPNSVNGKIVPIVTSRLEEKGATATVADLKELALPFFDGPLAPSNPDFAPTDEHVLRWTEMVRSADGVVLVTPEYNHTMSPVQLNAVDWIGKEWKGKPVALVGYGWTSGGSQAHETAREALAVNLKAKVVQSQTNLYFTKDITPEGQPIDVVSVNEKIDATLQELLSIVS